MQGPDENENSAAAGLYVLQLLMQTLSAFVLIVERALVLS